MSPLTHKMTKQAAKEIGIRYGRLHDMIRTKKITPAFKDAGGCWWLSPEEIEQVKEMIKQGQRRGRKTA